MSTSENIPPTRPIRLIVDNREKNVISKLRGYCSPQDIPFETDNLDVGDYHFMIDDKLLFVIERKTMADLASSIKDNRHREQKFRLKKIFVRPCKVVYLYEGKPVDFLFQKVTKETIISAINNTMIRDGFYVKETKDIDETCKYIYDVYNKLCRYHVKIINNEEENYSEVIRVSKKGYYNDPKNCYMMQLSQIPGISRVIADNIQKHYPTMMELCSAYSEIPEDERDDALANIMISTSGRSRKLGKKVSARMYGYISGSFVSA